MTKKDYQKFADLFVDAYKEYEQYQTHAKEYDGVLEQRNWPNWFENRITDLFFEENDRFDISKWSKWIDKKLTINK